MVDPLLGCHVVVLPSSRLQFVDVGDELPFLGHATLDGVRLEFSGVALHEVVRQVCVRVFFVLQRVVFAGQTDLPVFEYLGCQWLDVHQ